MTPKSSHFFENGTNEQFEFILSRYDEALQAKADSKNSKSEILMKLDKWYQNELPKKIKSRGKEAHLTHEEIVQTIKWKLSRGQFRPRLKDLIQMNTPRVVMQESKKAFRAIFKKKDLEAAVSALSNLKGVGPAMASAVLAAGAPDVAPFMADELLLSMPDSEGLDYTMKEYMKLVDKTKECVTRLNAQGGNWNPHKVELAVWAYYIARDLKPELLDDMPAGRGTGISTVPDSENDVEKNVDGNKENVELGNNVHDLSASDAEGGHEEENLVEKAPLQNGMHTNGESTEGDKVLKNGHSNGTKRALDNDADDIHSEVKRIREELTPTPDTSKSDDISRSSPNDEITDYPKSTGQILNGTTPQPILSGEE